MFIHVGLGAGINSFPGRILEMVILSDRYCFTHFSNLEQEFLEQIPMRVIMIGTSVFREMKF